MTKPRRNWCKLPLKATDEDELLEVNAGLAAAQETSADGAIVVFLSDLYDTFVCKKEERTDLKAFLCIQHVLPLLPTDFGRSLVKQCNAIHCD